MAVLIRAGDFVGPGERATAEYLERELPDSWYVIANKELVGSHGGSREVDFIVVGDHSVFVIEEKSWRGPIHGNENGWVLRSGESFGSPLRNVDGLSRRLAGMLRGSVPLLKHAIGDQHFVFGRVILSSPEAKPYIHDARASEQVLRLDGCDQELIRWDRLQGTVASIAKFRQGIFERLTSLQNRPKIPRQVNLYEVTEVLPSTGPIRTLRARHHDGSERLLKLISRASTLDADRSEGGDRAALREYEALRQLASTGVVPAVDPYFSWDQDHYWVVPISLPSGQSLRADRTAAAPGGARARAVCEAAYRALAQVHAAGIVHRAINPDRVVLAQNGRVIFTDFVIAKIEGATTVVEYANQYEPADGYRAPECRVGLEFAVPSSDVYELAASLRYWITGQEFDSEAPDDGSLAEYRPDLDAQLREELDALFTACLTADERVRPTAADVAARLAPPPEPQVHAPNPVPGPIAVGDLVENQYEITRILGEGATAITYLATDTVSGLQFVLKRIKNPELVAQLSGAEFRNLLDLAHPGIPRVFDVRHAGSAFHLKLEYIPGATLREVAARYRGDVDFCVTVGQQLLDTLSYLEQNGPLHRDISPSNIMVVEETTIRAKLIDFGLATRESDSDSAVGTPRYRAPEMDRDGGRWTPRCDLYSLSVVLFEVLTGRLPYAIERNRPNKSTLVPASAEETARIGHHLIDVLLRGSHPDPEQRYQSAEEFARALTISDIPEPTDASGEERINPTVNYLRGAYRNSRLGNADNRGLDTPFARDTYVPTKLDSALLPSLVRGDYRLVILSGNPGDGKTAFLERFRTELEERGASVQASNAAGWRFRFEGRDYAALYDASESHGAKTADELMHDVLRPLAGNHPPRPDYVAAIAANDGRLLDFFERFGAAQYGWLWPQIRDQITSRRPIQGEVLLVDLKRRSLAERSVATRGVFERILDQLVAPDKWTVCEGCIARHECPMRANALTFVDPSLSPVVRDRLRDLLLAVHLRRERRPTVRDLRSALSYLITHDLGCAEIHEERRKGIIPLADTRRLYFDAAFSGAGTPDLILDEWQQLDPGSVASPSLDRALFLHRRRADASVLRSLLREPSVRPGLPVVSSSAEDPVQWMASFKRRFHFEGVEAPHPLGGRPLPHPTALFPYQHFERFMEALRGDGDDRLLERLLTGLSVADGVPFSAASGMLALRVSDRDEDITVIKRFPTPEFVLDRSTSASPFVEAVTDHLVLRHQIGNQELILNLDLFELLMRASDGQLPGAVEQNALLEDITTFKNQLLARPAKDVIIVEGGRRLHTIQLQGGRIMRLQEAR